MIDKTFVDAITQNASASAITINGKEFATKPVYNQPLPDEPITAPLAVSTLTGFVDFCSTVTPDEHVIHVLSFQRVALLSKIQGVKRQREAFVIADCGAPSYPFGKFMDQAEFMIAIQTQFMDYGDRQKIMRVVGTIKGEDSKTSLDDGVTQRVTASSGTVLLQEVSLPNPVALKPFRTFPEIDQPPSLFVLRVNDEMKIALFEADGARWKHEAILGIREYLQGKTKDIPIVA